MKTVHRRTLWIAGSATLFLSALITLALFERRSETTDSRRPPSARFELGSSVAGEFRDAIRSYGHRLEESDDRLRKTQEEIGSLRERLEEWSRTALSSASSNETSKPEAIPPPPEPSRLRAFEFSPAPSSHEVRIPAGSFAEATLLTGVYAPVNADALPVLLRIDSVVVAPGSGRIPISGAFVVGKAQGDANSERAVIQLETLSFVGNTGRASEIPVNGWIVDDDGVQGLRGTYLWRAGETATLATMAGGASAAAAAASDTETTRLASPSGSSSSVTGDPLRFAGFRAAGGALERISEIIARRMEEIIPAVYVPNGKSVTLALISGATLTGIDPQEDMNAQSTHPFDGLDAHR